MLLLSFYSINFIFHENYFYFFMFRNVPGCFGMFRNVPCSGFYRRPDGASVSKGLYGIVLTAVSTSTSSSTGSFRQAEEFDKQAREL